MSRLTIGKLRGLQQISTSDGIFAMCAMDHRGSLKAMLDDENPEKVSYDEVVEVKKELCGILGPHASAVLLDPNFGAAQCTSAGVLPGHTGLLVCIESTGYGKSPEGDGRISTLLADWSVEKIKRLGASAVKILIYYRPDLRNIADSQLLLVKQVLQDCAKYDIPFLVETKSYPVGEEKRDRKQFASRRPDIVVETARDITALNVDVLKSEFPVDMQYERDEGKLLAACQRLNDSSRLPWVILSAGVEYETFAKEVEIACRAGASGFLGGSAIWQEAMRIEDSVARNRYLKTTVVDRLKRLVDLATQYGTPWYRKLALQPGCLTNVPQDWYSTY